MTFDDLAKLIRSRRTSMLVERDRLVPFKRVEQVCELAQWAPNHKRTRPWRFAFLEGEARARFGDALAEAMAAHGDPPEKVAGRRTKYLRTPGTLVVGAVPGQIDSESGENRDATAAGVQNILLAATALGLASYWSSCPKGANDAAAEFCGFEPGTHVTAIVYLGWAAQDVAAGERPAPQITHLV